MSIKTGVYAAAFLAAGFSLPAIAGPEHLEVIKQECGTQLNGSDAFCSCLAKAGGDTLSENQQAFAAATVSNNKAEVARTQPLLTSDDAIGVMNYMTSFGGCQR